MKTNKILIATGQKHKTFREISVKELVEEWDYSYFSNFMERWARDAVSNWVSTDERYLEKFVTEYLKIAHGDLIIDDIR